MDRDGTADLRYVGDFDQDGRLTFRDIQQAIDLFCDSNQDGAQDLKHADYDGDGALELAPFCGRVVLRRGRWLGGSGQPEDPIPSRVVIRWAGLTLAGAGRETTVLESRLADQLLFSRAAGAPVAPQAVVEISSVAEPPVHHVTLRDLRVLGTSAARRKALCAEHRCSSGADADADGTVDHGEVVVLVPAEDEIVIDNVWCTNADRQCFHVAPGRRQTFRTAVINSKTDGEIGEHCLTTDAGRLTVANNDFSGCDWRHGDFGGRAVELYCADHVGSGLLTDIQIVDNYFHDCYMGVAVISELSCRGTIGAIEIRNNVLRRLGATAIWLNSIDDANPLRSVRILSNVIDGVRDPDAAILVNRFPGSRSLIEDVEIRDNDIALDGRDWPRGAAGYGIRVEGAQIVVRGNRVALAAHDVGDATRDACIWVESADVRSDSVTVEANDCVIDDSRAPGVGIGMLNVAQARITENAIAFTSEHQADRSYGIALLDAYNGAVLQNEVGSAFAFGVTDSIGVFLGPTTADNRIESNAIGRQFAWCVFDMTSAGTNVVADNTCDR